MCRVQIFTFARLDNIHALQIMPYLRAFPFQPSGADMAVASKGVNTGYIWAAPLVSNGKGVNEAAEFPWSNNVDAI
jgi:hypothetical protein